jgi:ABC-type antimicrobial peptide transport system permease subunit
MGLAVGMACCILILLWVQDEMSYDRFHENADDIYRVIQNINFADHSTSWAVTQGPLGPSLKEDFPEIINAARMRYEDFLTLTYNDKTFDETGLMADGSIFEMFSFSLITGDSTTALSAPHSIVLSEELAEKYFGDEDSIGKTITLNHKYDFKVTGVLGDIPRNSSIKPNLLIPFIFGREVGWAVDRWNNSFIQTFVQLKNDISYQDVVQKISGYLFDKPTIEKDSRLNLQPLKKIHLYSNYDFDKAHGDISYVIIFFFVAVFIFLIACINYMNLATARSANRAIEVGVRRVVGAFKADIIRQFLGESILLSLLALFFAVLLVELLLPIFNDLAEKELSVNFFGSLKITGGLLSISLIAGILSGSYPAIFLSAFQPVRLLRGTLQLGTKGSTFRKILIAVQFSLTIILMICTAIAFQQLRYTQNKKLGYDREFMFCIGIRGKVREKVESVKNELLRHPNILKVTMYVGDDYFETFGMEIVEGRSFSNKFPTDVSEGVIVNEAAIKAMRMESPIGKRLTKDGKQYKIVGVVKNYHFKSLHHKIEPLILLFRQKPGHILVAKIRPGNTPKIISDIENIWKNFEPGYPVIYRFTDELLNDLYTSEKRIETLFRYFSILAIFIACLGLFGLASFTAEQRTKEIGIRKALGASISGIILMLSKEFTKWVLIANLIAWPVAYLAMNQWLQDFAYRIDIGLGTFILAAILALVIALLTVSYQAVKAAKANPVEALRYE